MITTEKKIQENPLPEEHQQSENKSIDMTKPVDKAPAAPEVVAPEPAPHVNVPTFAKSPPSDLYRRLLPAVLFLLTFVTVMTMLLVYMDTVALGAQQFRLNMSRDYELARISQESAALVAYVRQLHLQPRPPRHPPPSPPITPRVEVLNRILGDIENGSFVEYLPRGPRDPTTLYLEAVRGWEGVVVRAAPRDYLALRGPARALHACLSTSTHPREVTYHEAESWFSSRVLCLPLYTVLLAADAARAQLLLLAGDSALPALAHLPYNTGAVRLQVIDYRSTNSTARNMTQSFLATKNYTVAAVFDDGIMFALTPTYNATAE